MGASTASPEGDYGLPYKGVPVMLTTVTECQDCLCLVTHLSQRRHDEVCPAKRWHPEEDEPVLERARAS